MATVVLQTVGAAIGGAVGGPAGAVIGRAVGAAAGYAIDQQVFSKDQVVKGGRLENNRYLSSSEGIPIPKAYGRVRLGGQIIWATRFEERKKKSSSGGKGGPSVSSVNYKYFANFAVAVCEGEISHFGRIWADGKEINQPRFSIRYYKGGESQSPDPLIEALQGTGRTPAFKGTAYVVFEDFPIAKYGNRIPQISFEVIRSIASLDRRIKAVTLIPGATEFGYSPKQKKSSRKGRTVSENRHTRVADSDWHASMDELQAVCPNLETVSLVVSWFGSDLRVGECRIEPRCTHHDASRSNWQVNGITRSQGALVSKEEGRPAYGGTPSDQSVIDAIIDLKSRGLNVMFYPFIMMDIPSGNQLPSPYGGLSQPAYPWRGKITCHPAIGQAGTVDETAAARAQIEAFVGSASAGDYPVVDNLVTYNGPAETSYRRMVLHYASLCSLAGGVDRFLIGSELPGLTRIRDENDNFPFVEALVTLASDVRAILGTETRLSYAADWSEYFGYHPQNVTNDVWFNLDSLWASPDIDAVAIDNYMPISDWQDAGDPGVTEPSSRHDVSYLKSNIAAGEGADWFYESIDARQSATRTSISDGMGEPWIWGYKALAQWWQNPHHERKNGIRSINPTGWVPASKPLWFSEIGCPAVDRGANQPNVFSDAKSSQSSLPWFSKGGRDDLMQTRCLQAQLEFWDEQGTLANPLANPLANQGSAAMVSPDDIFIWAWDTRPYPTFPLQLDTWSDGENWYRGHWINGRLGAAPLDDLVKSVFTDHGLEAPIIQADGFFDGYVIGGETTPRAALQALIDIHQLSVTEREGKLRISGKEYAPQISILAENLVQEEDNARLILASEEEGALARQLTLYHSVIETDFGTTTTVSRRLETQSDRQITMEVPAVLPRENASSLTNARLRDSWNARHSARFSLSQKYLGLEPADIVILENGQSYQASGISYGIERKVEAAGFARFDEAVPWSGPSAVSAIEMPSGAPVALLMNLPLAQDAMNPVPRLYCAASQTPWDRSLAVYSSPLSTGFQQVATIGEPSIIGELVEPLAAGPNGRWDNSNSIIVDVLGTGEAFLSLDKSLVFAGANALAIQRLTEDGKEDWEIVQFHQAELIAENRWKLSGLLREQLGSSSSPEGGANIGAYVVVLDDTLTPLSIPQNQVGLPFNWRIGPVDEDFASTDFVEISVACNHISSRPLAPVHLGASISVEDYQLHWIRRSRVNSDSWEIPEAPLDYSLERYRVRILDGQGEIRRQTEVDHPSMTYSSSDRLMDLGSLTEPCEIQVAQLDDTGAPGPSASLAIHP